MFTTEILRRKKTELYEFSKVYDYFGIFSF